MLTIYLSALHAHHNQDFVLTPLQPEATAFKSADEAMNRLIAASGKLMLLMRMLRSLKAQGHRVLIFSQVHWLGFVACNI